MMEGIAYIAREKNIGHNFEVQTQTEKNMDRNFETQTRRRVLL